MSATLRWTPLGTPLAERLARMSEINPETGCWDWLARKATNGYGHISIHHEKVGAHRAAYETFVGPIPDGLTVDHLCFNRACINPEHMRLLTASDNARNQRLSFATHCAKGHEFTPENTAWWRNGRRDGSRPRRRCRACRKGRSAA